MLTFEQINALIDRVNYTDLSEICVKDGEFELKIKAKLPPVIQTNVVEQQPAVIQQTSIVTPPPILKNQLAGTQIKSPIVGTFYQAAAPDKPPFVTTGKKVKKGDVLFVIESMKLMNEIQSDIDGEVVEINVTDGQGVEYGQHILTIK